jgi:molybdate transport system substrate-binding protein
MAVSTLAVLAACGDSTGPEATPASEGAAAVRGKLTVFAASSLTGAFAEIAAGFKERYPDTDVVFNFQGSPTLRTQLEQGRGPTCSPAPTRRRWTWR